jgi:DNA-binding MarR family transcriptional regulator
LKLNKRKLSGMSILKLDQFLPYRLSVASNAVSTRIAGSYRKRFGLKIAEWRLIAILAETEAMTPHALGEATRMDKISVSRAAAALAERGLLEISDNPGDGRSHILSLSADGRSLYGEIAPLALEMEQQLLGALSLADRAQLDALLRRVEAAAY